MEHPLIHSHLISLLKRLVGPFVVAVVFNIYPFAQTSSAQHEANKLYAQKGYHAAAEKYGSEGQNAVEVLERLANGYRLNHDTQNAEKYYAQVVGKCYDPANYLYYAQALQSNGKPELAKEYFQKYDQLMASFGDLRGKHFASTIGSPAPEIDKGIFVENRKEMNSGQLDFSPVIFENKVVFASTRQSQTAPKPMDKWTGEAFSSLYFVENQEDGSFSAPALFPLGLGSAFHEGPLAFSKKGNMLYYTRNISQKNNAGEKEYFLKIATAVKDGKQWLKDDLPDLGGQTCNDVHPALSGDGQQLIFASDRPGGYGGMDLYVAYFSNGKWGMPVNLGPSVNTAGNEVFPFLHQNGELYFASDGWGGFGGLDLFFSKTTTDGDWSPSYNIGLPLNSPKDDFGLVLDDSGLEGYLTSARDGGLGRDDIYHFTTDKPLGQKHPEKKADAPTYDPIFSQKKIEEITLPAPGAGFSGAFLNELENASNTGTALQLNHIYYDYGQSSIRPDAASELDLLVQFLTLRPNLSIELISHTDSRGEAEYNKGLSELRAKAAANYLVQQGIPASRVTAIGMGEAQLLNGCSDGMECTEEEHQVNRRTEVRFLEIRN